MSQTGASDTELPARPYVDAARTYAASGSLEDLQTWRTLMLAEPDFDAALDPIELVRPFFAAEDFGGVVQVVLHHQPTLFLSPAAHEATAAAYRALDDRPAAEREMRLRALALSAIFDSGDGTLESPWMVLRISDEYDVLRELQLRSTRQSLVSWGGRSFDRHDCEDGSTRWFDVTDVLRNERRLLR